MKSMNRRATLLAAVSSPFVVASARAQGQFPDRALRFIVPYNPGGITDVMTRALANALTVVAGQSVVVENRAGANGSIGTLAAARADADGHTLVMGITDTHAINPSTFKALSYDPQKDFAPVSMVARVPFAFMVGPSIPKSIDFGALVDKARAEKERLSFASWGVGSSSHLAMEYIAKAKGFEKLHVPFTGQAPGMQAVAAGQVDTMMLPVGGAYSLASDGRARILGVASPERLPLVPDVPTMRELGVDLQTGLWLAVFAPARTPPARVARLNAMLAEAMKAPALLEAFRVQSAVPDPSTPEALADYVVAERARWAEVVKSAGIVVEG